MNSPVSSLNAISTPRSPGCLGSFSASLLVPIITTPSATVGLPYDCDPTAETHLILVFFWMSQVTGGFFMLDTMLRSGVPPHIGQSPVPGSDALSARADAKQIRILRFIDSGSLSHCRRRLRKAHRRTGRGCPGTQDTRPFVQPATCRARGPISARLFRERPLYSVPRARRAA